VRKTRLVLADDHAILRSGLALVLNAQPDMEVVGEASDGCQAAAKVRETRPDVLLLDYSMPGVSGVQLIERLRQECPQTRVLVLTAHDEPAYMRAVLAAGGAGYLVKTAGDVELISAIRAVSQGRLFVDLSLPGAAEAVAPAARPGAGLASLSEREREVFELLVQGHTNQTIADKLFLSVKTIETYRARVGNKLGIHSRADFVRFALESGVLRPTSSTPPQDHA
jgi:DNA-binding NarL/FixJ family response regulator